MITYGKQSIDESDIQAVVDSLKGDLLTTGPVVEEFEAAISKYTGARHAIACSNGTTALHLACLGIGLEKDQVGVTSPITFLASANCIEMCSGRVDFIDVDERICLDPNLLEDYCKRYGSPKVVVPVDFAGIPAKLEEISYLSQKYGFSVIEDASHSLGSTYTSGTSDLHAASCTHADVATLSFHPVKNITSGEGGAVLTNNDKIAESIRMYRSHGIERNPQKMKQNDGPWYHEMHTLGFNYRITDFQCALGLSQLKRLDQFKSRRVKIVSAYNSAFEGNDEIVIPPWPGGTSPCFHVYPVRFSGGAEQRKFMYGFLKENGILTQVHYIPVHLQPYYREKYGFTRNHCPVAEKYYSECLSLPLYYSLKDEEISFIVGKVLEGLELFGKK